MKFQRTSSHFILYYSDQLISDILEAVMEKVKCRNESDDETEVDDRTQPKTAY